MRPILYANLTSRIVTSELSAGASAYTFPALSAGDTFGVAFRFFEVLNGQTANELQLGVRRLRASIGLVDTLPTDGTFKLKIGSGTTLNTTAAIGLSDSAETVAALLNAVPGVQALGVVSVTKQTGSWVLEWPGSVSSQSISVIENRLTPISLVRINTQQINGRWLYEVRPIQAPLASTADWTRLVSDGPVVTKVKAGFIDEYELLPKKYPTVLNLYVPPSFRGLFSLRYKNTKTRLFDPANDGLDAYSAELPTLFNDSVSLSNPSAGNLLITLDGNKLNGSDVDLLTVEVFNAPPGDAGFDLSLATYELAVALRGVAQITVPFEIEADVVDNLEDQNDLTIPSRRITLCSTTVTIRQELNWAGLELVPQIDWLRPPTQESYVPFTRDQVITGTQSYVVPVGDGAAQSFTITHGLNTRAIVLALRENAPNGAILANADYTATIESDNQVQLTFANAPAIAAYVLTILAAGPKSAFQAHTHTIAQVSGLQDALSDFDRRIREIAPAQVVATAQQNFSPLADPIFQIPDIAELLPDGHTPSVAPVAGQLVYGTSGATVQGGSVEAQKTAQITAAVAAVTPATTTKPVPVVQFSIPAANVILPCSLPVPAKLADGTVPAVPVNKMPPLLAALRSTTPTATSVLLANAGLGAGTVYRATGNITLPGGAGRRSRPIAAGNYFASDGRYWYQVIRDGNDFYSSEFEQTLFSLPVDAVMLLNSKQLELVCSVALSLQNANVQAQQTLILELGQTLPGSGPANGLASIAWSAPILSQVLTVTGLETAHAFGVRLRADGVETGMYGNWVKLDTTPPTGNLILRARLTKFDCEDVDDPRGVLHVSVPATVAAIY